jgi:hypothetical protein
MHNIGIQSGVFGSDDRGNPRSKCTISLDSFTHPDAIWRNVMDPKPRLIDVTHVSFSLSPVARLFLNALSSCSNRTNSVYDS